ncbi:MAG TPA: hypothetical protein VFX30_03585 [bacterium]|nr:hypothetical protein [bacterium]
MVYPGNVLFPAIPSVQVSIPLSSLVNVAVQAAPHIASGDTEALRGLFNELKLPPHEHSAAVRDIAVGLSLSQPAFVSYFDEHKVRRLMKNLESPSSSGTISEFELNVVYAAFLAWIDCDND